jgi:hypothetical protein
MSLPGFTAEVSLYQTNGHYRMALTFASVEGTLQLAQDNCFQECMFDCIHLPNHPSNLECMHRCRCECFGNCPPPPTPTCINQFGSDYASPCGCIRVCDPGSSNTGLTCGSPTDLGFGIGTKQICLSPPGTMC